MSGKIVKNWPHTRMQVLEVPGAPLKERQGAPKHATLWLSPACWAHFVDLYLGAGHFKLEFGAMPEEMRLRALRAIESVVPDKYSQFPEGYRVESIDGLAFVIREGAPSTPFDVQPSRASARPQM